MFGYFNALNTSSQGKEILNNLFSTHFIKARKLLKNKNDKLFDFHSLAYTITSPFAVNDLHLVTLNTHLNATKFILCLELIISAKIFTENHCKVCVKITALSKFLLHFSPNFQAQSRGCISNHCGLYSTEYGTKYLPYGRSIALGLNTLESLHPRMICTKFE